MTRSKVLGLLAVGGIAIACNSIVGVEDVRLRGTGTRPPNPDGSGDPDPGPDPDPDPDAPVDAGTTPCGDELACVRYVFLTSATFDGNLNGLAGADAACFNAASKAAKDNPLLAGRMFHAWLSDTTKNVNDPTRFHRGTRRYIRVDGSNFAASFSEIVGSSLANPLNIDENGNVQTGAVGAPALSVWTATSATGGTYNGIGNTTSCNDWTSNAVTVAGNMGDSQSKTGAWTESIADGDVASGSCNSQKHLYCIEF